MTAQEKAKHLFEHIYYKMPSILSEKNKYKTAKQCSLIAVEEIIDAVESFAYHGAMYDDYETGQVTFTHEKLPDIYWREVKKEIEKL